MNQHLEVPLLPVNDARTAARSYEMNTFLKEAYTYWRNKGALCTLAREVADLCIALFILGLWLFLNNCVDYDGLREHLTAPQCADGAPNDTPIFGRDCYGLVPVTFSNFLRMGPVAWVATLSCVFFWFAALLWIVIKVPALFRMRRYFRDALRFDDRVVQTVEWPSVVHRILDSQVEYAIAPGPEQLSELDVVQCITQADDFMIGLHQENILDATVTVPLLGKMLFWPMGMQYAVENAVRFVVFDKAGTMTVTTENVYAKASSLRRLFVALGVTAFLLSPFIFLLRASFFVFRYVDDWRRRPGTLAHRCFDPASRWWIRRYCELEHAFEARLRRAHRPTTLYVRMFTNELMSIAARVVLVVCGGFVIVSLGLAVFVNESYLLAELLPGFSVAFFLGWAGVGMALASALVPDENRVFEPQLRLRRAAEELQHYPEAWRGNEGLPSTYRDVARLFPYKISVFAKETLGIVLTPLLLLFRLAPSARPIVDFYLRTTRVSPGGMGDVCSYAMFEAANGGAGAQKVQLSLVKFKHEFPRWTPATQWQRTVLSRQNEVLASLAGSEQDSIML